MPDIAMCNNSKCGKANECWRFKAIPNEWQSYVEFEHICRESNNYQWLYEIDDKPIRKEGIDNV